jgi:hypothetical protein
LNQENRGGNGAKGLEDFMSNAVKIGGEVKISVDRTVCAERGDIAAQL